MLQLRNGAGVIDLPRLPGGQLADEGGIGALLGIAEAQPAHMHQLVGLHHEGGAHAGIGVVHHHVRGLGPGIGIAAGLEGGDDPGLGLHHVLRPGRGTGADVDGFEGRLDRVLVRGRFLPLDVDGAEVGPGAQGDPDDALGVVAFGDVGLYGVVVEALGAQQQLGAVLGVPGPAAGLDAGLGRLLAFSDGALELLAQGAVLDALDQGLLFRTIRGPGRRDRRDDSEQHDGECHPPTGSSSPCPPLHSLADIMPRPWCMTV